MVPPKYLSNFWRTLKMLLINCEVNLILTWSSTCVITNSTGAGRFAITDTRLYVPVVTLSTQENTKLLQQLKSDGFICYLIIIYWLIKKVFSINHDIVIFYVNVREIIFRV